LIEKHDEDHNGQIDFEEFRVMMLDIMGSNENSAEKELDEVFDLLDRDHDGKLNITDMSHVLT
jgi:Ca2+-binding EF-hand superfamily protein